MDLINCSNVYFKSILQRLKYCVFYCIFFWLKFVGDDGLFYLWLMMSYFTSHANEFMTTSPNLPHLRLLRSYFYYLCRFLCVYIISGVCFSSYSVFFCLDFFLAIFIANIFVDLEKIKIFYLY